MSICCFFLSFYSLTKIRWTKLELRNDCHFRADKWYTDSTAFTKKCQLLQCDAVMGVTNEKKGSFHFILISCTKYLIRAISNTINTIGLMFHLNVLIINKSKGTRHKH